MFCFSFYFVVYCSRWIKIFQSTEGKIITNRWWYKSVNNSKTVQTTQSCTCEIDAVLEAARPYQPCLAAVVQSSQNFSPTQTSSPAICQYKTIIFVSQAANHKSTVTTLLFSNQSEDGFTPWSAMLSIQLAGTFDWVVIADVMMTMNVRMLKTITICCCCCCCCVVVVVVATFAAA